MSAASDCKCRRRGSRDVRDGAALALDILAHQPLLWHNQDDYRALGDARGRGHANEPLRRGRSDLCRRADARLHVGLENHRPDNAYGDADVRLLSTIAASMGVALENARLFDETQRLLKETERRSSELAVINSIQQGMAKELNFQAIVDLVGDKLREMFATGDLAIHWRDESTDIVHHLYVYEHGQRLAQRTSAVQAGSEDQPGAADRQAGRARQPRRDGRHRPQGGRTARTRACRASSCR